MDPNSLLCHYCPHSGFHCHQIFYDTLIAVILCKIVQGYMGVLLFMMSAQLLNFIWPMETHLD